MHNPRAVLHWYDRLCPLCCIGQSRNTVHATQFFEFLKGLAGISMVGDKVHLPPVLFPPMSADDVASGIARIAMGQPVNGIVEIGGPEQFRVDELVRRRLAVFMGAL